MYAFLQGLGCVKPEPEIPGHFRDFIDFLNSQGFMYNVILEIWRAELQIPCKYFNASGNVLKKPFILSSLSIHMIYKQKHIERE